MHCSMHGRKSRKNNNLKKKIQSNVSLCYYYCFLSLSSSTQIRFIERMMAGVRDEQWDILKIVCRQPYNFNAQYGLSFVNIKGTGNELNEKKGIVAPSTCATNQTALNSFFGIGSESNNNNNNNNNNNCNSTNKRYFISQLLLKSH